MSALEAVRAILNEIVRFAIREEFEALRQANKSLTEGPSGRAEFDQSMLRRAEGYRQGLETAIRIIDKHATSRNH